MNNLGMSGEYAATDGIVKLLEDGQRLRELHHILFNYFRAQNLILLRQNSMYGVVNQESGETLFEHESYTAVIKFALNHG